MSTAWTDVHPAVPRVEIVTGNHNGWTFTTDGFLADPCSGDTPAEKSNTTNFEHIFAANSSLDGSGKCKAWLIKPELIQARHIISGLGPRHADSLMREVFDFNSLGARELDEMEKGVKFLQQFDVSYDYLDENAEDIRESAWILLIQDVDMEEDPQCCNSGASLVQALMKELSRRAQLEEKAMLAFVRQKKSLLQPGRRSPGLFMERHEGAWLKSKNQPEFWEDLGFERLNDGHLFPRDLDWLFWSSRGRNASLLFEGPRPFLSVVGLYALAEEHPSDCE